MSIPFLLLQKNTEEEERKGKVKIYLSCYVIQLCWLESTLSGKIVGQNLLKLLYINVLT